MGNESYLVESPPSRWKLKLFLICVIAFVVYILLLPYILPKDHILFKLYAILVEFLEALSKLPTFNEIMLYGGHLCIIHTIIVVL